MDKPRVSRSYSSIQQSLAEIINKTRPLVSLTPETYKKYVEIRTKAGFTDDDGFINHLIVLAEKEEERKRTSVKSAAASVADGGESVHKQPSAVSVGAEASEKKNSSHAADDDAVGGVKEKAEKSVETMLTLPDILKLDEILEETKRVQSTAKHASASGEALETAEMTDAAKPEADTAADKVAEVAVPVPCPKCKTMMSSEAELEEHIQTCDILAKYKNRKLHKIPKFIYCNWCGMRFTDPAPYKKHYERYHMNHGPFYTCLHCDKKQAFTDKRGLVEHQQGDPVCGLCQRRYSRLDVLKLHIQNKNHDKNKKRDQSPSKKTRTNKAPHVPPVTEAVENAEPSNLPHGFSFMSVRLNPLHRIPGAEQRLLYVPETAYREGYTLKADFTATPFPEPPDEEEEGEDDCY